MKQSIHEKYCVISGATSGIGLACMELLLSERWKVIGIGRSNGKITYLKKLLGEKYGFQNLAFCQADLSIQKEVKKAALSIKTILEEWQVDCLDGLLNNAGTVPYWQTLTPEGIDTQWAVNHLAHFLLTNELIDLLLRTSMSRIVTVSSGSHYRGKMHWDDIQLFKRYSPLKAYEQSKLANVLFTAELDKRLGDFPQIRAFTADPGLVRTNIGLKSNSPIAHLTWKVRRRGGISPEKSAEGIVFLLNDPSIQDAEEIYWKHGKAKDPNPKGLDRKDAARLWKISSTMCGIKEEKGNG